MALGVGERSDTNFPRLFLAQNRCVVGVGAVARHVCNGGIDPAAMGHVEREKSVTH